MGPECARLLVRQLALSSLYIALRAPSRVSYGLAGVAVVQRPCSARFPSIDTMLSPFAQCIPASCVLKPSVSLIHSKVTVFL